MNNALIKTTEDYSTYLKEYRKFSFFSSSITSPICAYLYLVHKEHPNKEMINLCGKIINDNSSLFSSFRGELKSVFSCMLAIDKDPGYKMSLVSAAYAALDEYFLTNATLSLLSFMMADIAKPNKFYEIAERTKFLHQEINREHPFLTDSKDVAFVGLLAMSTKSDAEILHESEEIFTALKSEFSFLSQNALQSLAHVLVLCIGDPIIKCENTISLFNQLNDYDLRYPQDFALVPLGILANMQIPFNQLIEDIVGTYNHLENTDNYGLFGYGRKARIMHTLMIVAAHYMNTNIELITAITVSAIIDIEYQQAATAAAIT